MTAVSTPPQGNGTAFDDVPDTGKHLIESLPPARPENEPLVQWIASVERRLAGGGGGGGKKSDPPPPYRRTREYLDWIKWLVMTSVGLIVFGFTAANYMDRFQTDEEASAEAAQEAARDRELTGRVESIERDIDRVQLRQVRTELLDKNNADRLEQLVSLQDAETRSERAAARRRVLMLQDRIERRERQMSDSRELIRQAELE